MSTREEYIDKLAKQLKEWDVQLDKIQQRMQKESDETKKRLGKQVNEIKNKISQIRNKMNEVRSAGEGTFSKLKKDIEVIWKDVRKGFSEFKTKVKS